VSEPHKALSIHGIFLKMFLTKKTLGCKDVRYLGSSVCRVCRRVKSSNQKVRELPGKVKAFPYLIRRTHCNGIIIGPSVFCRGFGMSDGDGWQDFGDELSKREFNSQRAVAAGFWGAGGLWRFFLQIEISLTQIDDSY
jgi:hypothetical protein